MIEIPTPPTDIDLCVTAIEMAIIAYQELHGCVPSTVLYGRDDMTHIPSMQYGNFPQFKNIRWWIFIPDLPRGMWFVLGPEGLYGSPGA